MIQAMLLSAFVIPMLVLSGPVLDETAPGPSPTAEDRLVIQVFYKEQPPSLQTYERVKTFLASYLDTHEIHYLLMTEPQNAALMQELGLPTEHFPFGLAIAGKTSATIDGATIVFARFPDFMHHLGRHQGNWTLDHLAAVLRDPTLLRPENPQLESQRGGGKRPPDPAPTDRE